jgi:SAM-dependent methyltransferase
MAFLVNDDSNTTVYDDVSVEIDTEGSLDSARVIVPILTALLNPKSVIDFGCGHGAWLKAFQESGVKVIGGLDGPWVDQSKLLIDKTRFKTVDLSQPFDIDGKWDLAICVELAEHLPEKASRPLIRALTSAAPIVLFSAAIPGQTGTCHINEQWPAYWKSLFAERGFRGLDPIRRHVWQDSRVDWWYQQNVFLYASNDAIAQSKVLQAEEQRTSDSQLTLIHESVLENILVHYRSLSGLLKEVPPAAFRAFKRCLHR